MADLGSTTTDRRLAFTKYVTDNKRFREIEYEVEKGRETYLYSAEGLPYSKITYKSGTKFYITQPMMLVKGKERFAYVKIGNIPGFIPIKNIRKPTGGNGTQYEDEVVDAINNYILECGGVINMKLAGDTKIYTNLTVAVKVDTTIKRQGGARGDPKADIIVCRDKKNPLGAGSVYISHKKEGGPEAFQQYGGLTEQAGLLIYANPLTQKFLGVVGEALQMGKLTALPYPIMGTFKDKYLANMSIYGPDFGKQFSLQHTQLIGQGHPVFKRIRDELYELSFSSHMSLSGNLSHFTGGYTPVFGATFRAGRGFVYKGVRYSGARVAIYPQKLMATRGSLKTFEIKD